MTEKETKGGIKKGKENPQVDEASIDTSVDTSTLSSFEIFDKCIKRAENLVSVHDSTDKIEEISDQHYCDFYRAAVVLSISALDAFIRKVIISEIAKILSSNTVLNDKLSEYIKNLLNQDKLLEAARKYDLLERVEKAVKEDFETKSFQGEWKITSFLEIVGYKNIFSEVSIKVDINERNLKKKLNIFTNRRHIIAHSGDYDLNQNPHIENDIDKAFAKDCIETVRLFAKTINEIIENQ